MSTSRSTAETTNSPSFGSLKDLTTSKLSKPTVGRKINGRWSPLIGHGCDTTVEMSRWCKAQNAKLGEVIYSVINWPPCESDPTPQIPVEGQVKPLATKAFKRKTRRPPLTRLEQEICEITLGLRKGKAISQNVFEPKSGPEIVLCGSMVERGYMKTSGSKFHLTSAGITALTRKRSIQFGVVG